MNDKDKFDWINFPTLKLPEAIVEVLMTSVYFHPVRTYPGKGKTIEEQLLWVGKHLKDGEVGMIFGYRIVVDYGRINET